MFATLQADQLPQARPAGSTQRRSFAAAGFGALIERQMGRYGDKPFLTHYDDERGERVELSYRTFENWTAKVANLLVEELGIAEGARVAVLVGNTWRAVAISFACWRAGIGLLPLDPALPAEQAAARLRDGGAAAAFVADERVAGVAAALGPSRGRPALVAVGGGLLGRANADPATALDFGSVVLGMGDLFEAAGGPDSEALAGTGPGGGPTQGELLATAGTAAAWLRLDDGDRLLSGLPTYHRGALAAGLVAPFAAGGGAVLSHGWEPGGFWKRVADERVTVVLLQREQAQALLDAGTDPAGLDLGRLRTVACAPDPAPEALAAAWAERFPLPLSPTPPRLAEAGR
ncbi:MAG TPA: TIGR03089 family protein [Actinomycetes bacterium]